MGSVKLQARILAVFLLLLGGGSIAYQVLVQKVPLAQDEKDPGLCVQANHPGPGVSTRPERTETLAPFAGLQTLGRGH